MRNYTLEEQTHHHVEGHKIVHDSVGRHEKGMKRLKRSIKFESCDGFTEMKRRISGQDWPATAFICL